MLYYYYYYYKFRLTVFLSSVCCLLHWSHYHLWSYDFLEASHYNSCTKNGTCLPTCDLFYAYFVQNSWAASGVWLFNSIHSSWKLGKLVCTGSTTCAIINITDTVGRKLIQTDSDWFRTLSPVQLLKLLNPVTSLLSYALFTGSK